MSLLVDPGRNKSRIILAADDDPTTLTLVEAAVKGLGYTFLGLASGTECLSMVTRVTPHLILLDVQMPEIDGFETCRKLRLYQQLQRVPILFLTVRNAVEDVRKGMTVGGNDYMIKPVSIEKLQARIERRTVQRAAA